MIYLFESELKKNKSVVFALLSVYGIGKSNSNLVCKKLGFSQNLKISSISKEQIYRIVKNIESLNILLSSELRKFHLLNLKKLSNIKSYRGLRKHMGLPVRGQRTHTNAKTARRLKLKF